MARPKGGYHAEDGFAIPGTTGISGLLGKPGLTPWAAKVGVEGGWLAGRAGLPMPKWQDVLYPKKEAAAEAGTLAHELFEAHLRGQSLPEVPDTPIGRAGWQAYENAAHWAAVSGLSLEPYEKPLVSEVFRYGGTPDACAIAGDSWFLADWKTGGIYAEHLLQMAAYRQLLLECEGVSVEGCHLVRFHREHGDFVHHFFAGDALDAGWEIFRRLLEIQPVLAALEKRVR